MPDERVEYSTESGRVQTTLRGEGELGPFTLRHGEVANVLVLAGPDGRAPLQCEIIENGASVAVSHGDVAAICSAATAR